MDTYRLYSKNLFTRFLFNRLAWHLSWHTFLVMFLSMCLAVFLLPAFSSACLTPLLTSEICYVPSSPTYRLSFEARSPGSCCLPTVLTQESKIRLVLFQKCRLMTDWLLEHSNKQQTEPTIGEQEHNWNDLTCHSQDRSMYMRSIVHRYM